MAPNSSADARSPSIAILGGGISGLAAAMRLEEAYPEVDWQLYEAAARLGGVLETVEHEGWRIERSADNFLTRDPWAADLCRKAGIESELLPTATDRRRALVVHRGQVERVPEGFVLMAPRKLSQVLRSPILSPLGKARLACEPFIPKAPRAVDGDESVADFARRRLGQETLDRLVQPLVAGIYTADPQRLSMAATLPQFLQQEAAHGSLVRAAAHSRAKLRGKQDDQESGARYGLFMAPRLGMQQLIDAIEQKLPTHRVHRNSPVAGCYRRAEGGWRVELENGTATEHDAVLVTLPAYRAARLLEQDAPRVAGLLYSIPYAGASVVCMALRNEQLTRPIDGFGFVVPACERRQILAASFASYKFPHRAPEGHTLVRVFIGGVLQADLADHDDRTLTRIACRELGELVGLTGEPLWSRVERWSQHMPQYEVGHLERVAQIERLVASTTGLGLAGAALRGVGVPQCVHSGEQEADRLAKLLAAKS